MFTKPGKRRTLEYLIEFVLVVLGISLAFWLGERSEQRKKTNLEQEYLQNLMVDLKADVDLIDYLLVLDQGRSDILKTVEDFTQKKASDLTIDEVPGLVLEMSEFDLFYPNDFTYVTLKQSGDFKIIKSQTIRNLLVKLYSSYQSIDREQTNLVNSLDNNFFPKFYENYQVVTGEITGKSYFKSPHFINYVGFAKAKINTISIYFDRSKNLAEQAVIALEEALQ